MKRHFKGFLCALSILSITIISWKPADYKRITTSVHATSSAKELFEKYITNIYESAHLQESGLAQNVFEKAVTGFINLKVSNKISQKSAILTIIDFSLPSTEKRMWIVDMVNKEILLNTMVAHGQGSGENVATQFSDRDDSHQSSLGFYITDNVYYGKHGRSLRLDGLDTGFNASARARSIVVHAADYVSQGAINHLGYIGRSFGCPAVAPSVINKVLNTIKDKTVIFISGNDDSYNSKYINEDVAANYVSQNNGDTVYANL